MDKKISNILIRYGIQTPEQFAERILAARKRKVLTHLDLARLAGNVHVSTIYRWEKGKCLPKSRLLIAKLVDENII